VSNENTQPRQIIPSLPPSIPPTLPPDLGLAGHHTQQCFPSILHQCHKQKAIHPTAAAALLLPSLPPSPLAEAKALSSSGVVVVGIGEGGRREGRENGFGEAEEEGEVLVHAHQVQLDEEAEDLKEGGREGGREGGMGKNGRNG